MVNWSARLAAGRKTTARLALVLALGVTLAGCQQGTLSRNDPNRGNIPLSHAVLSELDAKGMTRSGPVLMRIFKQEAELEVWKKDRTGRYAHFKTYPICKYSGELGPKIREGDRQAPEGFYMVGPQHMNPQSSYFLSFNLGFPNAFDRSHGRTGSHLMVHGDCSSRGCYAMTDEAIAEVYALARDALAGGQAAFQVQAFPFRMTPRNLARHRNSPHMAFWKTLKQGNDHFEVTRLEPQVDVCERRYVFNAVSPGAQMADAAVSRTALAAASGPIEMRAQINDPWQGITTRGQTSRASTQATPAPASLRQPLHTVAPVTRAAPTRATAVTGSERPSFQAAGRCPAYVVPPAIRDAVAAKNARDMAQMAALSGSVAAAPARSGIDGGTHRAFADRFADRRVRVGGPEPALAFLAQDDVTTQPDASGAPTPAATAALVTAPVPRPSPVREAAAGRAPQETATAAAAAPAETQPSGNWLTRMVGAGAQPATAQPVAAQPAVAQPAAAAQPTAPATTVVARTTGAAAATTPAPAAVAPSTGVAGAIGGWFSRLTGAASEAEQAPAPATATPVPTPRPQASAQPTAPTRVN